MHGHSTDNSNNTPARTAAQSSVHLDCSQDGTESSPAGSSSSTSCHWELSSNGSGAEQLQVPQVGTEEHSQFIAYQRQELLKEQTMTTLNAVRMKYQEEAWDHTSDRIALQSLLSEARRQDLASPSVVVTTDDKKQKWGKVARSMLDAIDHSGRSGAECRGRCANYFMWKNDVPVDELPIDILTSTSRKQGVLRTLRESGGLFLPAQ